MGVDPRDPLGDWDGDSLVFAAAMFLTFLALVLIAAH